MKLIIPIIAIAALCLVAVFAVRFILGVFSGVLNSILGIAVLAALLLIVAWMFAYARKSR